MFPVLAWDNYGGAEPGWGSHLILTWEQFEPRNGQYRVDLFDAALARAAGCCFLQVAVSLYDKAKMAPLDCTPKAHRRSLRPVIGERTGEIPPYDAPWTAAYCRAITALADRYRDNRQVAGYWHAPGWNNETQAAAATASGDWPSVVRPLLREQVYYDSLLTSTRHALGVWGETPVWLPGAPSPGNVWGRQSRDLIATLLREGAGYLNCGLGTDASNACGLGERAGLGMFDIARQARRVAFEEGRRFAKAEPLELYWMLMRALHWRAEFVNLYNSISEPQWTEVVDLLPEAGTRWIVFRDAEFPAQVFTSGGKVYGFQGEPGCWGVGIEAPAEATPTFTPASYGMDRWQWTPAAPFVLRTPGLRDGSWLATVWRPSGDRCKQAVLVADECVVLPPGAYHRVDIGEQMLSVEQRVDELERRVAALEWARR